MASVTSGERLMQLPLKYIIRSSVARRLTTVITILGVALVVFVFTAVLMMANGVQKTLRSTGSDDNLLVARKAAMSEIMSIMDREAAGIIVNLPQVAQAADGTPMSSKEVVVIINLNKLGGAGISNVTVRGVEPPAFQLRPQVKITEGRMFNWGAREVIAGAGITKRFVGAQIGEKVKFGGDIWTVVGLFDAAGSAFDSELWGDLNQIADAFKRSSFSTITVRLKDPDDLAGVTRAFESDNRLQYFVGKREKKFFEEQSEMMATFIRILGIFITVIFSTGSTIGAMITMYGSVANRTTEIGTLRALGFFRRSILVAFLLESLALGFAGGLAGVGFASVLQFFSISTLNFGSFSELAFSFALSPSIVATSLGFSLLMGLIGGFLPAVRAARLDIIQALRAV
ncbi:MAG TPA: ABC transporter permease [Candidatus Limnocylindria bacterium]|nr:ABC transporter permease [Candidatus Limnocylindria bacterium]